MQVNNVAQSPNFGMSMYFTEKGAKVLADNASPRLIAAVKRVGEKVKDTKTYHVEMTADEQGNLVPRVVSQFANKYLPPYRANETYGREFLTVRAKWDGTNLGGDCTPGNPNYPITLGYINNEEAKKAYNLINSSDFDAAAEIASKLEAAHVAKEAKAAEERLLDKQIKEEASALVEKFGIQKPAGFIIEV